MKLGTTTRELVEVTQGLEAGEQVVLNPQADDPNLEAVSEHAEIASAPHNCHNASPVAALQ